MAFAGLSGRGIGRTILAAAIIAAVGYTWLHRDLFQHDHLQAFIIRNRAWISENPYAPFLFILAHVVVSVTFIPRSIIAVAAGVIWGLWWGSLLASLGCLAGASAGFLIARYLNDGLIKPSQMPGFGRLLARLEGGGWRAVPRRLRACPEHQDQDDHDGPVGQQGALFHRRAPGRHL